MTRLTPWYSWRDEDEEDARVEALVKRAELAARRVAAIRAAFEDADRKVHR